MSIRSTAVGAVALAAVLLGCGDDNGFTPESVAGAYFASTLLVTQNGITADVLALGGSLDIALVGDGTVAGHLFVPHGDENGADLDVDLQGTWLLNGKVLTFDMPNVDTFVRDTPFTVGTDTLTADHTFNDTRIQLVLSRRPSA
jgi:hypothetical protein